MDKHNRPYMCLSSECKSIRGFTCQGDLARHQKEQHGQIKEVLCPFTNCKRSLNGRGFSRGSNLKSHIKLMHKTSEVKTAEGEVQLFEGDIPRSGGSQSKQQSSSWQQSSRSQPQKPRTSPSIEEDRSSSVQHLQQQLQSPNLESTARTSKRRRRNESTLKGPPHFSTATLNPDHKNQAAEIKRLKQVVAEKDVQLAEKDVQLADRDSVIVDQQAQIAKSGVETDLLKELLNNALRGNGTGSRTSELL